MNYQEMLESRDGVATHREELPIGTFYKKLVDKKYRHVVELRQELTDSILFCEALKADSEMIEAFNHPNQLHFKTKEDSGGVYEIELEPGSFQTFNQMLVQNPAVVAEKNYIGKVVELMGSLLKQLHERGVFQFCLAPQFLFVRKNDNMPLLLCHGSFYKDMTDQGLLYQGFEDFVAPEVLSHAEPDERADVYAFGKFIEQLHVDCNMGFEYNSVVATATDPDPEKRFATIDIMLDAITKKRNTRRSLLSLVGALAFALFCVFLYVDLMPEPVDVEFVKPAVEVETDPYDVSLTPAELGLDPADSTFLNEQERVQQAELDAEIERIFRRHFTREAEGVLSKVYSKEKMNSSEQAFMMAGDAAIEELLRKRDALASQAGIPIEKAVKIAEEIINTIRDQKTKDLKKYGYQKNAQDDGKTNNQNQN